MAFVLLFSAETFADEAQATVKMTYVDAENPDVSYYETTTNQGYALTGYVKVNNGKVALAYKKWHRNWIAILQVDASSIDGSITGATFSIEGSGATAQPTKYSAQLALGKVDLEWKDDLTWNNSSPTNLAFAQFGSSQTLKTKSTETYEQVSWDISDAFVGTANKKVTLFVLGLNINGLRVKNPKVTVTYTPTESITTSSEGFATYAAPYPVNYSKIDGLKAYTIQLNETAKTVGYTEFTGVVPANQAVLIQGEASKQYKLTPATETADETFTTALKASDGNVTSDGNLYYAFSSQGTAGFKLIASGVKIPAKKGYLVLSETMAQNAKGFFAFDSSTTGITMVPSIEKGEETMYNLAGQRVGHDYKGIVIVNGKKIWNP